MIIENKNIEEYANLTASLIKQKRERRVLHFPALNTHMKNWVLDWEHSRVTRYGLEVGYYDEETVPFFENVVISEGKDVGYCISSGTVAGASSDSWDLLIRNVGKEKLVTLFKTMVRRGLDKGVIFTDFAASNVIFKDGVPCLIDLEGLESFSWLFEGKPLPHEAPNRNLSKCDNPLWRGFDMYYGKFMRDVAGVEDFSDTLNSIKSVENLYTILGD